MKNGLTVRGPGPLVKFEKKQDRYNALLMMPEVKEVFNERDNWVVDASLKPSISEIEDKELTESIGTVVKYVCKDLGITQMNNPAEIQYSATRFVGMLKRHYKDLTVSDVKLAFELLEVGELDTYLPKNRSGEADREHYQLFNVKFYTKVLAAYRKYKSRVWGKAQKAYGQKEVLLLQQIPEEDRKKNHAVTIEQIHKAFYNYKDNGTPVNFILSIFIKEFISAGLLELPAPTKEQIKKAYTKTIMEGNISREQRKIIVADYNIGKLPHEVKTGAQAIANNQIIMDYFDALIKTETDIKTVIK